jgi:Family of unknown function (DUF5989)
MVESSKPVWVVFLHENRKWWLLPFYIVAIIEASVLLFTGKDATPFVYTFF